MVRSSPDNVPLRVAFVSLGCAKNVVDSEAMLGRLAEAGCLVGAPEDEADVIVVNTCGFLGASRREAHRVIREAVAAKRAGRCRGVVVAGCLVQRDREHLLEAVPGIDALVGTTHRDEIVDAVRRAAHRQRRPARPDVFLGEYHPQSLSDSARLRITPRHYAYLRISEGCDQKCTFCTIPSIRGRMRSKPPEQVVAEARELVADGARELVLIGQDTTSYGADLGLRNGLADLLCRLDRESGAAWIRLMYVYPSVVTDDLIDAIAECPSVVKYVDVPIQHINDRILRRMHRRVTRRQTEALLQRLRERIPGVAIRTTLIAGFPGETEDEHRELVQFVRDFRFDALGVFAYSREPETPAGRMREQIPHPVRRRRVRELMEAQQEVAFSRAAEYAGRRLVVLIERAGEGESPAVARHSGQAPEVDSVTYVAPSAGLRPGQFAEVRCTGSAGYDLQARPVRLTLPVVTPDGA